MLKFSSKVFWILGLVCAGILGGNIPAFIGLWGTDTVTVMTITIISFFGLVIFTSLFYINEMR